MSCDLVRTELTALDRGELSAAEKDAVTRHVAGCTPCASELRRIRRVREMFVRATAIAPTAAGSARLMAAIDSELASQTSSVPEAGRGRMLDMWSQFRWRYERSASVRRFTIASIGVHAAAAAILAVALSTGAGGPERAVEITFDPSAAGMSDAVGRSETGLTAFDAATTSGVPGVGGRAFPNAAVAARLGAVCDPAAVRAALATSCGVDAALIEESTRRGIEWITAQQRDDGSFGAAEDTALAVFAQAATGRESVGDASLAKAVAAVERDVFAAGTGAADRAMGVRALVEQFSVDFHRLSATDREARRDLLARAGRALAAAQGADGAFARVRRAPGAAPGAPAHSIVANDVAATVVAAVALGDLRRSGILDTGSAIVAAESWLDGSRTTDGRLRGLMSGDSIAATAALLGMETEIGRARIEASVAGRIATVSAASPSTSSAWSGVSALRALGRPVREAVRGVARSQRADGSFADGKRSGVAATASGVLALAVARR